ncbi:hypothetical protein C8J57DRAFT_1230507 [Mycena rebaudengoi]|nr:hypothetical protein C8J57DRAFT_1230507 [Mycena rebaudengoi]
MVHTEASVATHKQCGVVQAVTSNAFRWLSAPYRLSARLSAGRNFSSRCSHPSQDPVGHICLNRSARRQQRDVKPHLLSGAHPPTFGMDLELSCSSDKSGIIVPKHRTHPSGSQSTVPSSIALLNGIKCCKTGGKLAERSLQYRGRSGSEWLCEWQEYGVRCTRHTHNINVPFCAVHGICGAYELAVGDTPAAQDLHEFETPPGFDAPLRKRSRKGKEKETQQPSNVIPSGTCTLFIAALADIWPEFRIIYAALDNAQKARTLQHLLSTTLEHQTKATANAVFAAAAEHQMTRCNTMFSFRLYERIHVNGTAWFERLMPLLLGKSCIPSRGLKNLAVHQCCTRHTTPITTSHR